MLLKILITSLFFLIGNLSLSNHLVVDTSYDQIIEDTFESGFSLHLGYNKLINDFLFFGAYIENSTTDSIIRQNKIGLKTSLKLRTNYFDVVPNVNCFILSNFVEDYSSTYFGHGLGGKIMLPLKNKRVFINLGYDEKYFGKIIKKQILTGITVKF